MLYLILNLLFVQPDAEVMTYIGESWLYSRVFAAKYSVKLALFFCFFHEIRICSSICLILVSSLTWFRLGSFASCLPCYTLQGIVLVCGKHNNYLIKVLC